jgi:farnesyl diphosphate synthase
MATKTSRPDFESIFPSLVEDLKEAAGRYKLPQNAMDWFVKVRSA